MTLTNRHEDKRFVPSSQPPVSGEYPETAVGKTHTFTARGVRYVRDYLNGSTSNTGNHWVELEVWGTRTTVHVGGHHEKDVTSGQVTKYYFFGGQRVAMNKGGVVYYLLGDHLGSTSLTVDASGNKLSELRYKPYGEMRYSGPPNGTRTDYRFTDQRQDGYINLYIMGARWYDPALGRWTSPDSIIPQPENPQSFNRYSYVNNRPLNRVDPSGHQGLPPEMQAAIDYFTKLGWTVVGDPYAINTNWNGADLVFTMGKDSDMRVLAVELKNVAGNINLGTLGKSATGDYGGSISRFIRSAGRFQNASVAQLRLMSQAVLKGAQSGTLENALFTTSNKVSEGAQAQFNGVYRLGQNGQVIVDKAIRGRSFLQGARDTLSSAWSSVKSAASSAWDSIKSTGGQIGTSLGGAARSLSVTLNSTETSVGFPVPLPGFIFDPTNPYSPLYNPAFQRCVD